MQNLKKIILFAAFTSISLLHISCNRLKDNLNNIKDAKWGTTEINAGFLTPSCKKEDGPNAVNAPYTRKIWGDEFNGPEPGESLNCYNDDNLAVCTKALSWKPQTHADCGGEDLSHLHKLNKCTWSIWKGYSTLEHSGYKSYDFQSIEMRDDSKAGDGIHGSGVLVLKVKVDAAKANSNNCNDSTLNPDCPIRMGGVDSNFRSSLVPGGNVTLGRLEIRAKIPHKKTGAYPALWAWPVNKGIPNVPVNSDTYSGEIDLWESGKDSSAANSWTSGSQHYHTWGSWNNGPADDHSSIGFPSLVNDDQYHRFGVEKFVDRIRFYIDDCYMGWVNNGEIPTGGSNAPMPVTAQTIYAIMNIGSTNDTTTNKSRWNELNGQEMLIDYVRVYGP